MAFLKKSFTAASSDQSKPSLQAQDSPADVSPQPTMPASVTAYESGCQEYSASLDDLHGHAQGFDRPELGISVFETSVVLLVVGIGCGLFFKGHALWNQSQAVALMDQVAEVEAAWYAFNDRFAARPGDSAPNGNTNGRVDTAVESANLWSHLFQAGYLTKVGGSMADAFCAHGTCLPNGYGGYMQIRWEGSTHQLHTGKGIPADVLALLDERYDDGLPLSGSVQIAESLECQVAGYYRTDSANCGAKIIWL